MGKEGEIQGEGSNRIQNLSALNTPSFVNSKCLGAPGYRLCKKERVLQHRPLTGTLGGGPTTPRLMPPLPAVSRGSHRSC